jgi:ABC-type lipoprotein release transport system permease subunit
MLRHFLKVAIRNLWKYKSQTLVSIIGLAVGFTCFAMATLWIRYEMTYDSFHRNADRIYCVNTPALLSPTGISRQCPTPLAEYLKATFPEVANATPLISFHTQIDVEGIEHEVDILCVDSSFFSIFDVKLVEGNMDFLIPDSKNRAITRDKAIQLFGNESPIGKTINNNNVICAVVTGLPKHSNYPFDILGAVRMAEMETRWNYSINDVLVEVVPNVNIDAFKQKLYEHEIKSEHVVITKMTLTPLTSVHYEDPNAAREVKFQHIILFAVAGSLLILCTLFNYLTLFVCRFRVRQKELALRTVYGASGGSLFAMLSVELIMSLIMALLLGLFFIRLVFSSFGTISGVRSGLSSIYLESIVYIAVIIAITLAVFFLTLVIFKRRTLDSNIRSNKKMFRRTSIVVQLIISIVFAFCTTVILKQMYHLHNTNLGFAFKNRGSIHINYDQAEILNDKIKQIPEIEETLIGYFPLLPKVGQTVYTFSEWDGKPEDETTINIDRMIVSEQYLKYYEFDLIEGEMLNDNDSETDVMINELAAKMFGWDKPVGKMFAGYRVKGVLKNIYNSSPTIAAKPFFYRLPDDSHETKMPFILLKCHEGSWKTCVKKIKTIIADELSDMPNIYSDEEEYDKYLKSENTLLQILTVVSLVCMIVCIFGFVSMVSLTCEERRKEIAVRKIHGATVKDILDIFFKEYLTLLVVGAVIAFPVGYVIMKRWLENYVVQTEISAWIYAAILLVLIMTIVICVGGKVYRTSRTNPAEAIKG